MCSETFCLLVFTNYMDLFHSLTVSTKISISIPESQKVDSFIGMILFSSSCGHVDLWPLHTLNLNLPSEMCLFPFGSGQWCFAGDSVGRIMWRQCDLTAVEPSPPCRGIFWTMQQTWLFPFLEKECDFQKAYCSEVFSACGVSCLSNRSLRQNIFWACEISNLEDEVRRLWGSEFLQVCSKYSMKA